MHGTVHLTGPITGLSYAKANGWHVKTRAELEPLGICVISPLRHRGDLEGKSVVDDATPSETRPLVTDKGLKRRARFDIARSDIVLANFLEADKVSIGSVMEITWADEDKKPVIAVMHAGNPHDYSLLRDMIAYTVATLEDGLEIVKYLLLP